MRARKGWEALDDAGICPECLKPKTYCQRPCPKYWFDRGYRIGYHDGANNMPRHDSAFVVEMMEDGRYSNDDE